MIRPRVRLPGAVLIAAVFLAGVAVGRFQGQITERVTGPERRTGTVATEEGLPAPLSTDRIREVWDVLHEKFAGPLNDQNLAVGALRGIAAGSSDPYTSYADPDESKQFEADISGSFTGIGVEITLRRGVVTVIAPLRGSPAERAGIRARDVLVKIDGTEINHTLTLTEVVSKIRGPAGTDVMLTVAREGQEDLLELRVRRERISIETVKTVTRDGIAILTVSAFNEDTARRFRAAARNLLATRGRGLVLDLRNNPGGLLESAVEIAGHFLPRDAVIVTEVPRAGKPQSDHRTEGPGDLVNMPTVVLMNGGSASAAEILAAALNEQRGVPLVGEQTFGKGSVQELVNLSDGASLRVTVARWHTPKGREITEEGIAPTERVEDPDPTQDPDEILNKGIELLTRTPS